MPTYTIFPSGQIGQTSDPNTPDVTQWSPGYQAMQSFSGTPAQLLSNGSISMYQNPMFTPGYSGATPSFGSYGQNFNASNLGQTPYTAGIQSQATQPKNPYGSPSYTPFDKPAWGINPMNTNPYMTPQNSNRSANNAYNNTQKVGEKPVVTNTGYSSSGGRGSAINQFKDPYGNPIQNPAYPWTTNTPSFGANQPFQADWANRIRQSPSQNPFINSSGGFSYGALPGMWNFANSQLAPNWQEANARQGALADFLGNQMYQGYPQGMSQFIQNAVGGMGNLGMNMLGNQGNFLGGFQPNMNQQIMNLLGGTGQNFGNAATLAGGNGQYGLSDLYSQIMTYGLPNQQIIESLAQPQASFGQNQQMGAANILNQLYGGNAPTTAIQDQATNTLSGLIQNGGLSPEVLQAYRERILAPSQENLQGRLNQAGGGVVAPTSGLPQELLRRNEADFNNNMIMAGMQNLGNYLGQGLQAGGQAYGQGLNTASLMGNMGQQGIGNAMQSFQNVASNAAPYLSMAGNLQNQLYNQGISGMSNAANLGYMPLNYGSNLLNSATGTGQNLLNSYMQGMLGLQGNQQNYALGTGQQYGNLAQAYLQALVNRQNAQEGQGTDWGSIASSIAQIAPLFFL